MPSRCARHRIVGGPSNRRVSALRARRHRRCHCLARSAAVVQRTGRHVRLQLLGVQLTATRLRAATRARRDLRDLRNRRPLHRRRALHGWSTSGDRSGGLLPLHGSDERAAAGAGDLGRRMARRVAGAHHRARAVVVDLDGGATRRAVLAARLGATRLRADRMPDDDRRRVGRRLPQQHVPTVRAAEVREGTVDRPMEPHGTIVLAAGPAHRPGSGDDHVLRQVAARRPARATTTHPGVRATLDQAGAGSCSRRRRVAIRGQLATTTADTDDAVRRSPTNARHSDPTRVSRHGTRARVVCRGVNRWINATTTRGRWPPIGRSPNTPRSSVTSW